MAARLFKLVILVSLTGTVCLNIIPLLLLIFLSLGSSWHWPYLLPPHFSLSSWAYVLNPASGSLTALITSFKIALAVALINLMLALPAAKSLAHYRFRGKRIIEIILLLPALVPPWAVIAGIHKTFIQLSLADTVSGVVLSHLIPTLPYMVRTLKVSFANIDNALEEQAWLLGADKAQTFFYITLPLLLPGIAAGSILSILISLSEYLTTLIIGGGKIMTLTLVMFPFVNGGNPSIGAAYSLLFALLAVVTMFSLDLFINRYYSENKLY